MTVGPSMSLGTSVLARPAPVAREEAILELESHAHFDFPRIACTRVLAEVLRAHHARGVVVVHAVEHIRDVGKEIQVRAPSLGTSAKEERLRDVEIEVEPRWTDRAVAP